MSPLQKENQEKSSGFSGDIPSPFHVLTAALSRVPGLRILFGVVAVLAILAIARVWALDRGWTIVGGCAVVLFSLVLLVLAKFSASKTAEFRGPAKALMWFSVVLFMVWCCLLTGCVFFKWPLSVSMLPVSPAPQPPRTSVISGTVLIDGLPASDRHDLKLTCATDTGFSLEPVVQSGAGFRIFVPDGTAFATVTARAGDRIGKAVFDVRSNELEKLIILEPISSGPPLQRSLTTPERVSPPIAAPLTDPPPTNTDTNTFGQGDQAREGTNVLRSGVEVFATKYMQEYIGFLAKGEVVTVCSTGTNHASGQRYPWAYTEIELPARFHVFVNKTFIDPITRTVAPSRLKIRAGPGENHSMVAILNQGDAVKVINERGDWLEIQAPPEIHGYVRSEGLTEEAGPTFMASGKRATVK